MKRASAFWRKPRSAVAAAAGMLALVFPSLANAQTQASVPTTTELLQNLEITKLRDLDFGRIIVPNNGRVDMTADDASICTANNGLQLVDPCQSAQFEGQSIPGLQLRISVPAGRRIVLTGPGQNLRLRRMSVGAGDGLTFQGRQGRNFDFLVTDAAGEFEFFVAGRLLFRNNQTPGIYTGTFTIEADFQ